MGMIRTAYDIREIEMTRGLLRTGLKLNLLEWTYSLEIQWDYYIGRTWR